MSNLNISTIQNQNIPVTIQDCINLRMSPTIQEVCKRVVLGKEEGRTKSDEIQTVAIEYFRETYGDVIIPEKDGDDEIRASADFIRKTYPYDYINVKYSSAKYKKNKRKEPTRTFGQPNMVSINRLIEGYCLNIIKRYWILDINNNRYLDTITVTCFDLLQNLHLLGFSFGPQQTMLISNMFYKDNFSNVNFDQIKSPEQIDAEFRNLCGPDAFNEFIKLRTDTVNTNMEYLNKKLSEEQAKRTIIV